MGGNRRRREGLQAQVTRHSRRVWIDGELDVEAGTVSVEFELAMSRVLRDETDKMKLTVPRAFSPLSLECCSCSSWSRSQEMRIP